jgi:hypothetical protein
VCEYGFDVMCGIYLNRMCSMLLFVRVEAVLHMDVLC